jgi:hypothetical protein
MTTRHSNLGTVPADLGDLTGARTHHERALEIGQTTLRSDRRFVHASSSALGRELAAV